MTVLTRLPTGIIGLDRLCGGGLPAGRATLVTGSAGTGKTLLCMQFLLAGCRDHGENGIFVTFEERPQDVLANASSLGWDLVRRVEQGSLAVLDRTRPAGADVAAPADIEVKGLLKAVEAAVEQVGARRIVLDSVGSLFPHNSDPGQVRAALQAVLGFLSSLGLTVLVNVERPTEDGPLGRFGIEEFVADNVVVLRNRLEQDCRRRTLEILKLRGFPHQRGEFTYTIASPEGFEVLPLLSMRRRGDADLEAREATGLSELDEMLGGGLPRGAISLVSGPAGIGKTLLACHFAAEGLACEERCLFVSFEESRRQLLRNAAACGIGLSSPVAEERLYLVTEYPEERGVEEHLVGMRRLLASCRPQRVVIDSLSALTRLAPARFFQEFLVCLTHDLAESGATVLLTHATESLLGGRSLTGSHLSTLADSVLLMRYVEFVGEMRRGLAVLKVRGSAHDRSIRDFWIEDGRGIRIGAPIRRVDGIIQGLTRPRVAEDTEDQLEAEFPAVDGS